MKKKGIFIALGVLLVIAAVVVVLLTKKTPIKTYTVTFDTNGGTTIESQYVEEGNLATKPTDPQKEGYTFLYWTYNNREFNFSTPIVEDIILVAEYTNNEYIITFDSNGGSSVEKQYVVYGGFINTPEEPTKLGYEFLYWSYDDKEFDFTKPVKSNMTLVAVWKEVKYTVIFDGDNSSFYHTEIVLQGYTVSKPVEPTKYGYKFLYWSYNNKEYDFNTPITDNITLIAKWEMLIIEGTEGVKYKIDETTQTCSVSGYYGSDEVVVIASHYHNLPVVSIDEHAFRQSTIVTDIYIHDGITTIGQGAFYGCINLKNIVLPNELTKLNDNLFAFCKNIESITIPNSVTYIGKMVFHSCESLKDIKIPTNVTQIDELAFADCISLETIVIPNSVMVLGGSVFNECEKLIDVTLPNNLKVLPGNLFSSCTSLKTVKLPESIIEIKNYAFSNCTSLESIVIPSNVSFIGASAFSNCTSLKSIIIPLSVTTMDDYVFSGCVSLSIKCEASSKPKGWEATWNISKCPVEWNYKN